VSITLTEEAIALTKLTIGGQSDLYELFRKKLDCADQTIRKLELTYFAASVTAVIYLRLGKQPNREQILDVFAKYILKGSITASQEPISFGSAVAEYQRRYVEYDRLLGPVIVPESGSTDNPAEALALHLFECVTGKTPRGEYMKIIYLYPYLMYYVLDVIEYVREKMRMSLM
jgi:hypothetical protein